MWYAGISSAGLFIISVHAMLMAKVDDPCLAVSSSLVAGIWGSLCAGFMPKDEYLPFAGFPNGGVTSFSLERGEQFGVQVRPGTARAAAPICSEGATLC